MGDYIGGRVKVVGGNEVSFTDEGKSEEVVKEI